MAKKPTSSNATATGTAASQADETVILSTETSATSSGVNGPDGANTPESTSADGTGAGNPAGPADNGLAAALLAVGCDDLDGLVGFALFGRDLCDVIDLQRAVDGPLKDWTPVHSPIEVVNDLVEVIKVLEQQLAVEKLRPIRTGDKRIFRALSSVRHNNEYVAEGGWLKISETEHEALAAATIVDPDWDEGV